MSVQTESQAEVTGFAAAVAEWRRAVGDWNVLVDGRALAEAGATTFPTTDRTFAIVRPFDRGEVQACLRIANAHGVPMHPFSAGKNLGYGRRVPPADGCALLDLSRMDRIVELNEQLGFITVEPGVTFAQAHALLAERGARLVLANIGGPPSASLVGNALERGDGDGLQSDAFASVCGMEVVLPTGALAHTGHGWVRGQSVAPVQRWGVGPSLDGLFSQSNLGVVTQLTLWLAPKARYFRRFVCEAKPSGLAALVDDVQRLMFDGTVRGSVFFWNDVKRLAVVGRYPFAATGGRTPLPASLRAELRDQHGIAEWAVAGSIRASSHAQGTAALKRATRYLSRGRRPFLSATGSAEGSPSDRNLAMAFWRKRPEVLATSEVEASRCGFLWTSVAVPFSGAEAQGAVEIAEAVFRLHGFEPNLSLCGVTSRCIYLVAAIAWDRDTVGDDAAALACQRALARELIAAGYPPARLGLQDAGLEWPAVDDTQAVVEAIRDAIDPNRILSPGRYELGRTSQTGGVQS